MADLTITAASVLKSGSASVQDGIIGAATTVTAGKVLYLDSATNTLLLADNTSATKAAAVGIALTGGGAGQPVKYVISDPALVLGCTMTVGDALYVSNTAGGITLTTADLDTGEFVTFLGVCTVINSTINMSIAASGAARTTDQT